MKLTVFHICEICKHRGKSTGYADTETMSLLYMCNKLKKEVILFDRCIAWEPNWRGDTE